MFHTMFDRVSGNELARLDSERRLSTRKRAPAVTYSDEYGPKRRVKKSSVKDLASAKNSPGASVSEVATSSLNSEATISSPDSTGRGATRACVQGLTPDSYAEVNSSGELSANNSSDNSADQNYAGASSGGESSDDEYLATKRKVLKAKKPTQDEMTNLEINLSANTNMLV